MTSPLEKLPPALRRWRYLAGLGVLAVMLAVFLLPGDLLLAAPGTDMAGQFVVWRAFAADNLRAGHLPLWNPYSYAGQPFLGDFQSALLYPPNVIFLFLPLARAINLSILLHLLLLGWGVGYWVKRRGLHPVAAMLCGFVGMFSGPVLLHVYAGHLSNICSMAWAPWILCGLEVARREKNFRALLLAAAAICLQILAGNVQYVFYTAVAAGLQALAATLAEAPARGRALPMAAAAYAFAAMLAAAQLLPGFAAAAEGVRQGKLPYFFVRIFSFAPENLLTLVAPGFFGNLVGSVYWGRAYLWEMSLFVGVAGVALAFVALADKQARRPAGVDFIVAALLFLLALGDNTPLLHVLYDYVPGFGRFRGLSKFTFPALLLGLLIIGAGADALIRRNQPRATLALLLTIAGIALGSVGIFLWFQPDRLVAFFAFVEGTEESYLSAFNFSWPHFINSAAMQSVRALAAGGALLCLLGAALSLAPRWPWARWLPLAILPVEMLVFASANFATMKMEGVAPLPVAEFIKENPGDYRVFCPFLANNGYLLGAPQLWGGNPAVLKRYAEFMTYTQKGDLERVTQDLDFNHIDKRYALLRLRYAFEPTPENVRIIVFDGALPHALLVPGYRVLPGRDAIFAAIEERTFNPRRTVLLESEPAVKPQPGGERGTVHLVGSTTDSLTFEADVPAPALLLVTDLYSRDWRARALPGSSQTDYEILPADYILRAIPLAAGHHRLVIEYAPPSFRYGIIISLIAWAGWVVLLVIIRRRKSGHELAQ